MSELRVLFVIGLIGCLAAPLSADVQAAPPTTLNVAKVNDVPMQRIYIRCEGVKESEVIAFRKGLMARGAERVNFFVPSLIVCELPVDQAPSDFIRDPRFTYVEESRVDDGLAPGTSDDVLLVRESYRIAETLAREEVPLTPPGTFEDRVLIVPPEIVEQSKWAPHSQSPGAVVEERSIPQNSEFMIGDVLVRLIFPESVGGGENSEEWTDQELRDASLGAASAVLAFQQFYAYVPMSFVFTKEERVETRYEPIQHTLADDAFTWIPDVMNTLGFTGLKDVSLVVHDYNNAGRKRFGTDWVYTAFVADSRNEPGNVFGGSTGGGGYTAYANLGGPYLVMPFPAGNNDPNELGEVLLYSYIFQHEMGHIFWALDEYPAAPTGCDSHAGYLDYLNLNKVSQSPAGGLGGCPTFTDCMMWNPRLGREGGRPLCFYTSGQMGVVDANNNFIPDVFDRPPAVVFENAQAETVETSEITLKMKIVSQAVANRNPLQVPSERIDYAAPLKDATFDVDGIGGTRVKPDDGRWDETEEDLTFTINGLNTGVTRVDVTARNSFGATSPKIRKSIYFIGVKFGLFELTVQPEGIRVAWQTVGETFGAQVDLYRIGYASGRPDTTMLVENAQTTGNPDDLFKPYLYFDTDVNPGHEYRYFIRGHFVLDIQGEPRAFESVSNAFEVRAMLPMRSGKSVSIVAPNPFSETTSISVNVPKSFAPQDGDKGAPNNVFTGIPQEIPTAVSVTVYDVLGRLVKRVFNGEMFSRVETFTWDGTNLRNTQVPSGIYFIRAVAGPVEEVRKVVVVR